MKIVTRRLGGKTVVVCLFGTLLMPLSFAQTILITGIGFCGSTSATVDAVDAVIVGLGGTPGTAPQNRPYDPGIKSGSLANGSVAGVVSGAMGGPAAMIVTRGIIAVHDHTQSHPEGAGRSDGGSRIGNDSRGGPADKAAMDRVGRTG